MTMVVNVRFRDAGKPYRFSCDNMNLSIGDAVMVETNLGLDLAHVCVEPYEMEITKDSEETRLLPVLHIATEEEIAQYEEKCKNEEDAYVECVKLIEKHGLEMNLVDALAVLLHSEMRSIRRSQNEPKSWKKNFSIRITSAFARLISCFSFRFTCCCLCCLSSSWKSFSRAVQ